MDARVNEMNVMKQDSTSSSNAEEMSRNKLYNQTQKTALAKNPEYTAENPTASRTTKSYKSTTKSFASGKNKHKSNSSNSPFTSNQEKYASR